MNLNWIVVPTLLVSFALYWWSKTTWIRRNDRLSRFAILAVAGILSIPGLLIALYYLHLFDDAAWFYQFRSLPFSELTAAGVGLLAGILAALNKTTLRSQVLILILLFMGTAFPHLKPVIAPITSDTFQDRWIQDVCLQSTSSSCGPACAATLFRKYGIHFSEKDIARRCFTSRGGTENWYLARLFRENGFRVEFITKLAPPTPIPAPSIAGVRLAGVGHFIPLLSETNNTIVTGDPLVGLRVWTREEIQQQFDFTGFFMTIERSGEQPPYRTRSPERRSEP
jgi:hypothetical protein